MFRLTSAAILTGMLGLAVFADPVAAKGPVRAVLSGGDLSAPITIGEGIDGREIYGDGTQMDPPLPYPQFIYTLELYAEDAEATDASVSTIYYYPEHDGLPSAFRTSYGFFAVTEDFDARLRAVQPAPETVSEPSGGTIADIFDTGYIVAGLAMGLVLIGGGFVRWSARRQYVR